MVPENVDIIEAAGIPEVFCTIGPTWLIVVH